MAINRTLGLSGILALAMASFSLNTSSAATAQSSDAYAFVSQYVQELGETESIRANAEQELKKNPSDKLGECIENSTRTELHLRAQIAGLQGVGFKAPFDTLIPTLTELYQKKLSLYQQMGSGCSEMVAGPRPNVDYGKIAAEAPKITATLDYIDHAIFDATPVVFGLLIDKRPDAQNHVSHLIITRSQRDHLVRTLNIYFGKKMDQTHQNWIVSVASVLRDYLLKKGFKASDEL